MTKRYMPLSLAIREGCKKTAEARGAYVDTAVSASAALRGAVEPLDGRAYVACVLGAAYYGADGEPGKETSMQLEAKLFPLLRERCGPIVDANVFFPGDDFFYDGISGIRICNADDSERTMPMWAAIEQLFEGSHWTRQEVADFVSTYEAPL